MSGTTKADQARTIAVLHPGEMGAAIAGCLAACGHRVTWASEGRSAGTRERAERAQLTDVRSASHAAASSEFVLSICPPAAAEDVAASLAGFSGFYVDANAVSPATAQRIARAVESRGATYVDGGIIGPPPGLDRSTRLYLSGGAAADVARLFHGTSVDARVLDGDLAAASALKMVFASWSKGSTALLISALAAASALGVEDELREEWDGWRPELGEQAIVGARSAAAKGWRWRGEMEEIAATFAAAGMPSGFHLAAAELYSRLPRQEPRSEDGLDAVLEAIRRPGQS